MLELKDVFVDVQTLTKIRAQPDVVLVDVSWHMPTMKRDAYAEFLQTHIPGAIFFDQDDVADLQSPFSHTYPSPVEFAEKVGQLGISSDDEIIVYEHGALFAASRAWWLFKSMGAKNVRILSGGLEAWLDEDYPVEAGSIKRLAKLFVPNHQEKSVVQIEEMLDFVRQRSCAIVDARNANRFKGLAPEPRPNVRSGSVPGSLNLPYESLLCTNGKLMPVDKLKEIISTLNLDPDSPVVTMCGSGMTAATLLLALRLVGFSDVRLYDGSWTEWGTYT